MWLTWTGEPHPEGVVQVRGTRGDGGESGKERQTPLYNIEHNISTKKCTALFRRNPEVLRTMELGVILKCYEQWSLGLALQLQTFSASSTLC